MNPGPQPHGAGGGRGRCRPVVGKVRPAHTCANEGLEDRENQKPFWGKGVGQMCVGGGMGGRELKWEEDFRALK